MGQDSSERLPALYVGIGVGMYDHKEAFDPLPQAIPDVREVGEILKRHRYEVYVIEDPTSTDAPAQLKARLPEDVLKNGGSLIVLWAGHGEPTPEGILKLITKDSKTGESSLLGAVTAEGLASQAARTGANQILLLLDTCYSGKCAIPSVDVADRVVRQLPPNADRVWIGVIASAMDFERAKDGVFGSCLIKLLREGPSNPELRLRWSAHNAGVRGDDLIDALVKECRASGQEPKPATSGNPWVMLPNPFYNLGAPERVVEHLLLAARGVEPGEEGFYFTGRVTVLNWIVSWIHVGKPGLFVVTGPAGSGKTAIVGRIVSLSNPEERARLFAQISLDHADPGEDSVHAHVHARGLTAELLCEIIDGQLVQRGFIQKNPAGPRNRWELIGALQRSQSPPIIVLDGLDEAGSEAWRIATDVIQPLSDASLVLISTRELAPREDRLSLLQSLKVSERDVADLGSVAYQESTLADVRRYVEDRLISVSRQMDPIAVGEAIIRMNVPQNEGLFLLARIITAQLRAKPIVTAAVGWVDDLDRSIEAAFDRDLSRIPPLLSDEKELRHAARELLTALAWSYGSGLPDDVWPIVASALSSTGGVYQRRDVFWLLDQAGRYVVESGEGGRAVYRLIHQCLVDHLRKSGEPTAEAIYG
jgi:hypothetical protein